MNLRIAAAIFDRLANFDHIYFFLRNVWRPEIASKYNSRTREYRLLSIAGATIRIKIVHNYYYRQPISNFKTILPTRNIWMRILTRDLIDLSR